MDPTLLTILLVLAVGTGVSILQARRRDRCLRHLDGYRATLAEADGDLVWGDLRVYATGIEIEYVAPVHTDAGHLERSFLLYRDQYASLDAIYRYPRALTDAQRKRRADDLRRTVSPSILRRAGRTLGNWLSMVRDAVTQAVSVVIGMAKARAPGPSVLATQEQGLKTLSGELIGYAGNAFDPLLERHLFERVVVEVTREGRRTSYCGWLKDYSTGFLEILDAIVPDHDARELAPHRAGTEPVPGVALRAARGEVVVENRGAPMLYVRELRHGAWSRRMDTVVPPGTTADIRVPPHVPADEVEVWLSTVQRVDIVLPRTHAIVRHAAVLTPSPARPERLSDEEAAQTVAAVAPEADPSVPHESEEVAA